MKKNPMKQMSDAELMKKLADTREELRTMRFSGAGSRLKDPYAPSKARRDVARVLTELTVRTRSAAGAPQLTARTNAKTA